MFLISSWFISIGYSKKIKFSIIGIIGTLFYLYMYYNIFDFILTYKNYASNLYGNDSGFNFILGVLSESGKHISIGFYVLLIGFIGNSMGIFGIIYRTYISLNNFFILQTNPNAIIRDDGIRIYDKINKNKNQNEIKNEVLNIPKINQKSKSKLYLFFIGGNIINLIGTGIALMFLISSLGKLSPSFTPNQVKGFILGMILTTIFLNLHIINHYIKRVIEEKILFKYFIGIGVAYLFMFYFMINA
ncbi:MAG: hypothetical protein WC850_06005 [Candidatus Gracilibacteria bacterium]